MRRSLYAVLLLLLTVGCGGGPLSTPPSFNLTGMWKVWGQSTVEPGTGVIVDVNMIKIGTNTFGDAAMGVYAYNSNTRTIYVGGTCGESSLSLSENSTSISYTLKGTQNITGIGTISKFTIAATNTPGYKITGTYEGCNGDHGTFTAQQVAPISAIGVPAPGAPMWVGNLTNGDFVTAGPMVVKSNNSNSNFSTPVSISSGPQVPVEQFTCGGGQYGNTISCGGMLEGEQVSALAWYDQQGLLVQAGEMVVLAFGPNGSNPVTGVLGECITGPPYEMCVTTPRSPDPIVVNQ
jgi:hypothetical protein